MSNNYIPKDLDDCFDELERILDSQQIEEIKNMKQKTTIIMHHGLGRRLRNKWKLWGGSRLSKWFKDKEIQHPDDMSGIVITSFWRYLNNEPIEIDEQIKYYKNYWENREKK